MEVDQGEQINSDAGVVAAAACHRVDEAVVVFVAGGAIVIDDQVFVRIDVVWNGDHGESGSGNGLALV